LVKLADVDVVERKIKGKEGIYFQIVNTKEMEEELYEDR